MVHRNKQVNKIVQGLGVADCFRVDLAFAAEQQQHPFVFARPASHSQDSVFCLAGVRVLCNTKSKDGGCRFGDIGLQLNPNGAVR